MRKATFFIVVALLLAFGAAPVSADVPPALPHAFYGNVTINGNAASVGTSVEARVEGVLTSIAAGNPITVTEAGKYGGPGGLDPKLVVQGNIDEGAIITFYVNGVFTGETYPFDSGEVTPLPLSVTIPVGGGAGIAPAPTIATELFGVSFTISISEDGEILETIEVTSEDGMFTITILEGTIALDADGNPLETLQVDIDPSPPDPPEDAYIIGLAYDFGPDGATFDPPIIFTWRYDPDALPEDVVEEDLVVQCYPREIGEWEECISSVDTITHTLTVDVDHFTTFAIIAPTPAAPPVPPALPAAFTSSSLSVSPLEVDMGETVTVSILLSNTGEEEGSYTVTFKINGVVAATREITLAGGISETVTFTTTRDKAGSYSVNIDGLTGSFTVKEEVVAPPEAPPAAPPEVKPETNWPVIGGVIGGVIIVALLIFFMVRRRASA